MKPLTVNMDSEMEIPSSYIQSTMDTPSSKKLLGCNKYGKQSACYNYSRDRRSGILVHLVSSSNFFSLMGCVEGMEEEDIWIPRHALVLSAFIIQFLSFTDYSHINIYSGNNYKKKRWWSFWLKISW
jgi:hypothetical protein